MKGSAGQRYILDFFCDIAIDDTKKTEKEKEAKDERAGGDKRGTETEEKGERRNYSAFTVKTEEK